MDSLEIELGENIEVEEKEIVEDEIPEVQEKTICKSGDLWTLGKHRLLCGDSTIKADVERLMGGEKADVVLTDPPYGYIYESNHQTKHKVLINDDKFLDFIPVINGFLENNCGLFIFSGFQVISFWIEYVKKTYDFKNLIVWKKNNWSMGDLKGSFAGRHELIIFCQKGRVELSGKRYTDVWEFDREPPKKHPTQKPIALISFAIKSINSSLILDPFLGSGTTLIACEQLDRICYGMEISEKYCDVIIRRFINMSGKDATRQDGKKFNELETNA